MKIVAFLQNQWFKDPEWAKQMLQRYPRHRFLHCTLFMGCKTGQNLRIAFGDLCEEIYWEEVSREIGGHSSSAFPPDLEHISAVLDQQRPDVVLAFGKIATKGVKACWQGRMIEYPHPAARFITKAMLLEWRTQLEA